MEWINIDRDKYGFATEECLDMMFTSLPFVVAEQHPGCAVLYTAVCELNDLYGWRGEIERNTDFTHFLQIQKLNQ